MALRANLLPTSYYRSPEVKPAPQCLHTRQAVFQKRVLLHKLTSGLHHMMRKNGIQPENIPLKALNKTGYQNGLKETVTLRLKILFCGTVSRNDHRFTNF